MRQRTKPGEGTCACRLRGHRPWGSAAGPGAGVAGARQRPGRGSAAQRRCQGEVLGARRAPAKGRGPAADKTEQQDCAPGRPSAQPERLLTLRFSSPEISSMSWSWVSAGTGGGCTAMISPICWLS